MTKRLFPYLIGGVNGDTDIQAVQRKSSTELLIGGSTTETAVLSQDYAAGSPIAILVDIVNQVEVWHQQYYWSTVPVQNS